MKSLGVSKEKIIQYVPNVWYNKTYSRSLDIIYFTEEKINHTVNPVLVVGFKRSLSL